jgi:predicted NAD-dependent protein-ADP-ribosyltransferase YbiA (DUF1768 family)
MINISYESDRHAILSNVALRPFTVGTRTYLTVEHAWQSWKTGSFDSTTYNKPWAGGIIFYGGQANTTGDWHLSTMETILRHSFQQNPDVLQILLDTAGHKLVMWDEKRPWATALPVILEKIRDELLW